MHLHLQAVFFFAVSVCAMTAKQKRDDSGDVILNVKLVLTPKILRQLATALRKNFDTSKGECNTATHAGYVHDL